MPPVTPDLQAERMRALELELDAARRIIGVLIGRAGGIDHIHDSELYAKWKLEVTRDEKNLGFVIRSTT